MRSGLGWGTSPTALLRPCPVETLLAYPVSTYVNAPAHDGPEAIAPLGGRAS